jgi:hypothetical protein
MKLHITYDKSTANEEDNIIMEKKTVFNRKIPKNASLVLNLNYYNHNDNFSHLLDLENGSYYLEIELFGEDRKLRKVILFNIANSKESDK